MTNCYLFFRWIVAKWYLSKVSPWLLSRWTDCGWGTQLWRLFHDQWPHSFWILRWFSIWLLSQWGDNCPRSQPRRLSWRSEGRTSSHTTNNHRKRYDGCYRLICWNALEIHFTETFWENTWALPFFFICDHCSGLWLTSGTHSALHSLGVNKQLPMELGWFKMVSCCWICVVVLVPQVTDLSTSGPSSWLLLHIDN